MRKSCKTNLIKVKPFEQYRFAFTGLEDISIYLWGINGKLNSQNLEVIII
jgi:hypothetical protein